jgi:hypothetical protein
VGSLGTPDCMAALLQLGQITAECCCQRASGRPGSHADWAVVYENSQRRDAPRWHRTVGADRLLLADNINDWLHLGNVRPKAFWHDREPSIMSAGARLFSALAAKLLLAIPKSGGLAVCTNCGTGYTPSRRPVAGRRNDCFSCRASGAPRRDASRDWYPPDAAVGGQDAVSNL